MVEIEEETEKEEMPSQSIKKGKEPIESNKINNSTPVVLDSTTESSQVKSGLGNTLQNPPYPERLAIEKPIMPESDLEVQLRNLCVKIPLLQAIKDIPILAKTIKEL